MFDRRFSRNLILLYNWSKIFKPMLPIYSVSETSVLYGQDLWNTHSYDVKNHFAEMRTITDYKLYAMFVIDMDIYLKYVHIVKAMGIEMIHRQNYGWLSFIWTLPSRNIYRHYTIVHFPFRFFRCVLRALLEKPVKLYSTHIVIQFQW